MCDDCWYTEAQEICYQINSLNDEIEWKIELIRRYEAGVLYEYDDNDYNELKTEKKELEHEKMGLAAKLKKELEIS